MHELDALLDLAKASLVQVARGAAELCAQTGIMPWDVAAR
jgi:fructose-1,6-bisphosphatase/inositol monophosphatase family enzyme